MNFLQKIQNLPAGKRKIILWAATCIIGLALLFLYIKYVQKNILGFGKENIKKGLNLPNLEEGIKKLPGFGEPENSLPQTAGE